MDEQPKDATQDNPLEGCPENLRPVVEALQQTFSDVEFGTTFFRGEAVVMVPTEKVVAVLEYLKTTAEHGFDYLVDVGGLHNPGENPEMLVFYNLLSIETGRRLRIKTPVAGNPPKVPSVTSLWKAADWHEREAYDMYGIRFEGHPDLRRMFLPESVDIHPLRKEYPLRGDNDKPSW